MGRNARGKRNGTGPYRAKRKKIGRRKAAGIKCPKR